MVAQKKKKIRFQHQKIETLGTGNLPTKSFMAPNAKKREGKGGKVFVGVALLSPPS